MVKTYARRKLTKSMKGRVAKLESQMRARKPELKMKATNSWGVVVPITTATAFEVTALNQGPKSNERIGKQIRIHKIVTNFDCGGAAIDVFLIKSSDETAPVYADFYGSPTGGLITGVINAPFTPLRHFYRTGDVHNGKFVYNNPRGLVVEYSGLTGDCIKNNLWVVFKNQSNGSRTVTQTTVIYYTDC